MKINTGDTRGIIRKLDELGRIVVPRSFRRQLELEYNAELEIFLLKDGVYLKKAEK